MRTYQWLEDQCLDAEKLYVQMNQSCTPHPKEIYFLNTKTHTKKTHLRVAFGPCVKIDQCKLLHYSSRFHPVWCHGFHPENHAIATITIMPPHLSLATSVSQYS